MFLSLSMLLKLNPLGNMDVVVGDMMDQTAVYKAFTGVDTVYHICSALNPNEVEIGQIAINAAKKANIRAFCIPFSIAFSTSGYASSSEKAHG